jgi:hypothetical protein
MVHTNLRRLLTPSVINLEKGIAAQLDFVMELDPDRASIRRSCRLDIRRAWDLADVKGEIEACVPGGGAKDTGWWDEKEAYSRRQRPWTRRAKTGAAQAT